MFDECVGFLWVNGQGVLLGDGLVEVKKKYIYIYIDKRVIKVNNTYSHIILIMD